MLLIIFPSTAMPSECSVFLYLNLAEYTSLKYSLCEAEQKILMDDPKIKSKNCAKVAAAEITKFMDLCNRAADVILQVQSDLSHCKLIQVAMRTNMLSSLREAGFEIEEDLLEPGYDNEVCGKYIIKKGAERTSAFFHENIQIIP